jgi:branched-chain amino acid transport system permease protein
LLAAFLVTALVALVLDRAFYKPMRDRSGISLLIASVGVALVVRYLIQFVYGSSRRGITASVEASNIAFAPLGISVNAHELTIVVAAIALMLGMHFMLQRTKLGTAMRAMADNRDLALITGIPTERVVTATWLIGGGLAGVSGYLYVLLRGTIVFNFGWLLLLLIFAAVILGGIGSIYGAIAGGLVIGIVFTTSTIWISSDFNEAAAFAVMILVLLFRPQGIFGGVTTA